MRLDPEKLEFTIYAIRACVKRADGVLLDRHETRKAIEADGATMTYEQAQVFVHEDQDNPDRLKLVAKFPNLDKYLTKELT